MATNYKNWQIETDADHITWLTISKPNSSANTINDDVLTELNTILNAINEDKIPARGLIIRSDKKNGFIAGADLEEIAKFNSAESILNFIHKGQQVLNKLAVLKIPTLCLIEGFCMGGGLELALACRYRIAEESSKTRLALPEILLGIHPGWGGSIRLPRLIGAINAMDLMLTGRSVSAKAAAKLGLIDAAVPKRQLLTAAKYYILKQPSEKRRNYFYSLTNHSFIRPLLGKIFIKRLKEKVMPAHYPAPYALVENWIQHGVDNINAALAVEAESVKNLALNDTTKNLIRVFFLRERLKGMAKETAFQPTHVHVIGAGTMGGDIAAWCALQGMHVTLQDREAKYIAPAIKRAYALFKKKLKTSREIQQVVDHLIPDPTGIGLKTADVVIEAIYENLAAKQALFKEIEAQAKPDAILATNTSSIPLDEINQILNQPERLVGIHFFNPVAKMPLVEVVQGKQTDQKLIECAMAFVGQIDRLPLPVKSSPGFLVNRILMPYLLEAVTILNEGVSATAIDKAAVEFGMPMGPIELADTVGLDICLSVAENLVGYYGGTIPTELREKVAKGELGRKTNKGFYSYKNGKMIKPAQEQSTSINYTRLSERLIFKMINEAQACLREKVVADSDLLDAGMIFGTGFAPFRGGPMQYIKTVGTNTEPADTTT